MQTILLAIFYLGVLEVYFFNQIMFCLCVQLDLYVVYIFSLICIVYVVSLIYTV